MELDTYAGMTLLNVKEILGEPDLVSDKEIDNNYLPTPIEPPYFIFFTEDELKQGVTITLAKWIIGKGKKEILVWLKERDGELIVFTSQERQRRDNGHQI